MNTSGYKINLPDFLVAELYKNTLVDIRDFATSVQQQPVMEQEKMVSTSSTLRFLGQNDKHVLIVVRDEIATFINDQDLEFLVKVLKACQLNMSDIAIVNNHHQPAGITTLREQFTPKQVLMFDVSPADLLLPFTIPHFQVQEFGDCTYLFLPRLAEIAGDGSESKVLKTKLWLNLQKAFKLA